MTKNTHLKRRVLLALMSILLVLGIYAGSAISVHAGDLTIKKTTEDGKNGEFSFRVRLLNMRYAVAILGIGVDTLEDGSTAGLTFGPATGENYCSSYHSHTPSGKTTDGNAHRCVHDDTWQEILQWNQDDPWVYEQCVAEGCTHGINLYPQKPLYTSVMPKTVTGDGGSALFDEIDYSYSRWNQKSSYTYHGWIASAIRGETDTILFNIDIL